MRARPADDQGAILVLVLVVVVILAGAIAAVAAFAFTGPRSSDAHTRQDRVASALDNAVQGEIESVRTGESSRACATLRLAAADGPTASGEPVSAFGDEPIDVVVTCKATRDVFRLCATPGAASKPELSVTVRIKDGSVDVRSWQMVPDCDEATP